MNTTMLAVRTVAAREVAVRRALAREGYALRKDRHTGLYWVVDPRLNSVVRDGDVLDGVEDFARQGWV